MEPVKELDELIQSGYVPVSIERKKAVLMYFMVGILVALGSKKFNKYEKFHLKQAIGWWVCFFVFLVLSIALIFLPYIKFIPFFIALILLIIWCLFVKQAWDGLYSVGGSNSKILLPIFAGIGGWVLDIFEIEEVDVEKKD